MTRYLSYVLAAVAVMIPISDLQAEKVGSTDIKKNAVRTKHIKKGNVTSSDIKNRTIGKKDLNRKLARNFLVGRYRFVDSNGKVVGSAMNAYTVVITPNQDNILPNATPAAVSGDPVVAQLSRDYFSSSLYYTKPGCDGAVRVFSPQPPPVIASLQAGPFPGTSKLTGFLPDPKATPADTDVLSRYDVDYSGTPPYPVGCRNLTDKRMLVPGIPTVDLSGFQPPFRLVKVK